MGDSSKAVFLSYASQDAEAVRRIAEALRAAGVEVWFDQNELVGGDAWDAKIRQQIAECALFVPVISAATQARLEGYFRLEWKLAAQRTHTMADEKVFLLPVVIDATRDSDARVPAEFRAVQWTRLVGGEVPALEKFCGRVANVLAGPEVARAFPLGSGEDPGAKARAATPSRRGKAWWGVSLATILVIGALAIWRPWKSGAAAPATEAQQLVAKARAIWEAGDELNRETYVLAEELLLKAEKLDPTEASAWALHAIISRSYRGFGFDMSAQRVEALRMQADRAAKLAPGSLDAQIAAIAVRYLHDQAGARQALVELAGRNLGNSRVATALGMAIFGSATDQALLDVLERSLVAAPENVRIKAAIVNALYQLGRVGEAEERVAKWLPDRPNGRILWFDFHFKRWWRGDLAGAAAAIERWPAWLFLEDRGVEAAGLLWHWKRDGERLLRTATSFPRDYVRVAAFTGPRSVLRAWALELLGRSEQARAEWQNVVRLAERELEEVPGEAKARFWKAWALARLGQKAEAESLLRLLEEDPSELRTLKLATGGLAGLQIQLGYFERALSELEANVRREVSMPHRITKAQLALSPIFDPLRQDPRFAELLRAAPGPEVKGDGTVAVTGSDRAAPAPNEKSLVVLPLENLSPDPENAFFTDGMHAEITTTLSRIADLKVISRESAVALKGFAGSLAEKARRVVVANVITGSVRREGTRVLVVLELRRARDETLLWAQRYDKQLGAGMLAIQSDIADQIGRTLQARESKGSFAGAKFMTAHPEAYDLFLKASQIHYAQRNLAGRLKVIAGLEQALALDPNFPSAARLLALANAQGYSVGTNPERRFQHAQDAKRWAEIATRLLPGGPCDDALAGYYSLVEPNNALALSLAESAVKALPNDAAVHNMLGNVLRDAGRSVEAATAFRQAISLDPFNAVFRGNLFIELARLRRAAELADAEADYVAVAGSEGTRVAQSFRQFMLTGGLPADLNGSNVSLLQAGRRDAEALAAIEADLAETTLGQLTRWRRWIQKCDSLRRLHREADLPPATREAKAWMEKLNVQPALDVSEHDGRLAVTMARLGQADESIAAGHRYVAARSPANQVRGRWEREIEFAHVYACLARPHECYELLARLLRVPSGITVPMLKVDPAWDNVRDDPAFQALLADPKNSAPL